MKSLLVMVITAITTFVVETTSGCPFEKSRYTYTGGQSDGTAEFVVVSRPGWRRGEGDMAALHLSFQAAPGGGRFDDWFIYDQGSSADIHLFESTDRHSPSWDLWEKKHVPGPLSAVHAYIAWDRRHVITTALPAPGKEAPAFIFLPYLAESLLESSGIDIGPGMFRLDRCDR